MTNLTDHQFAGDARHPFSFGGAGSGPITVKGDWGTANLTINSQQKVYKFAKAGFVNQFAIKSDTLMDSHATPLLTVDVGIYDLSATTTDDDEFMAAVTAAQMYTGHYTNTASTGTATAAGFEVEAGDIVIVSVKAAAATAVAGEITLSFQYTAIG